MPATVTVAVVTRLPAAGEVMVTGTAAGGVVFPYFLQAALLWANENLKGEARAAAAASVVKTMATGDIKGAAELIAGKGIPVVLISGHPAAEQIVVDFEPVAMMIRKPATIEKPRAAIEQIMYGR